jgi:hypothetical protein
MSYIALATTTLSSPASSVTFSSIPTSVNGVALRDLVVVMTAATSQNSNNIFRFNSDAGNNYFGLFATGSSGATSGSYSGSFIGSDSSAFTTTVVGDTNTVIQIMDFSATDKHKSVLVRANRPGGAVDMIAGRWGSNNAINSILFRPDNGSYTWSTGSSFSLYGIAG